MKCVSCMRTVSSKIKSAQYSSAAENAKIIDENGPDLPQKLWNSFLKLEQLDELNFRSHHLLKGRRSEKFIYGGQVVAQALKSACKTVNHHLPPHSIHSYFIKAGSVYEPVNYTVKKTRDGKSFATRMVEAHQNGEILYTAQYSFQKEEESTMHHQPVKTMPPGPDGLLTARRLMKNRLAENPANMRKAATGFLMYKLAEFPPTFHKIFEARPVNQNIYKMERQKELHEPDFSLWIKPTIPIGDDPHKQRLAVAYISDSSMVETALMPHIAQGLIPAVVFSLDHCLWFHRPRFSIDDWVLLEQYSDFAGGNRTCTRSRMFSKNGDLIMTAMQEGLVRAMNVRTDKK